MGTRGCPFAPSSPGVVGASPKGSRSPRASSTSSPPVQPPYNARPGGQGTRDKGHGDPLPIWGLGAAPSGLSIPLQPPPPRGPPLCGPPPFVPGRARGLEAREGGTHTGEEPAKIWGRAHLSLPAEPDVRGRCAALRGGSARGRHTKAAAPLRAPGECGPHGVPRPPRSHPHAPGGGRRGVMG